MYGVAVIGCGVIGLTSALAIKRRLENVKVTIFTRDVTPDTTSDVAAGYWKPYLLGNTPTDKVKKWSKATYDYILKLWKEGKADEAGISLQLSRYVSDRENCEIPDWIDIVLGYSRLPKDYLEKLSKLSKRKFISGYEFVTFTWEASFFLPFLEKEFLKNGGRIIQKNISDFTELRDYDVIVNCTGLYAKDLTCDTKVYPIRGQIARVVAPWQFYTILVDSEHDRSCYVIPNKDCVIVGGTSQPVYDTNIDEVDKKNIFKNCRELIPSLSEARIIKHQVGLRPGRDSVRLEIEIEPMGQGKNGPLRIVHNYGHGGAGITLCIGCAEDCAELTEVVLSRANRSKL